MKIKDDGFGFRVPEVVGAPNVGPDAFVIRGVPELGATGQKIGTELAAEATADDQIAYQRQHEERVQAEGFAREAKRADAMTVHAKAQNALADAHDALVQGVQSGQVPTDQASKIWGETSQKIVEQHLQTVDKANVELVRAGLEGNVGQFGRQINQAVTTRNRQQIGAKLGDYLEQMQRFAVTDLDGAKKQGTMAIDAQGPLAGYNPEQVQKLRQNFIELSTFNATSSKLNGSMNDRGALEQFLKDLPGAADLDPGKKNVLESKALTMITHLDNRATAAQTRLLSQLQVAGNRLETRIAMGVPIPDAELAGFQSRAKGTVFEEFATGLVDEQKSVAELLKKPPAEQAAYVANMEQQLVQNGVGNPRLVARLQKTVAGTIKMLNDNPVQYAMDRGGATIEPLDMKDPASWGPNLAHRADVIRAQHQQVGGAEGVLLPQEVATLSSILKDGTPETKKSYLEPLRRSVGDDRLFRATVQQFAKDSPVTALAASISTKEAPIVAGSLWWKEAYQPGDTAALLLRGEQLLNPPKSDKAADGKSRGFPMPKEADEKAMRTRFADTVGEVFADNFQAYDVQYQAARSMYAALSEQKGDMSGELDNRRWAESLTRSMPIGQFNGKSIMKPWGQDDAAFKNSVANAFPAALKAAGLPGEMAGATSRFTLQNRTGTSYYVRQGTEYLTGPRGRVVIQVPETPGPFRDEYGRRPVVPD